MAGEKKENSVLFTLKELKDITSEEATKPARPAAAPARAKPKRASILDEADSLLADLRDSVDADAVAEAARLEAERQAASQAAQDQIMRTAQAETAQINARIEAEQARRAAAAAERAAQARALDIAERRARGEIIEEDQPPPQPVVTRVAPTPSPAQPEPPAGRSTGFYLTVVGLPVICLTAVALVLILKPVEQPPAPVAVTPKPEVVTVVEPVDPVAAPIAVVDDDFEPDTGVADAAPKDAGEKVATAKKRPKKRRPKAGTAAKKDDDKKKTGGLKLDLGGGSGITF